MPNIIGIYIVSKAGSLIYDYENAAYSQSNEVEKTFSYPLDLILAIQNKRVTVVYGKKGTIKIGHVVLAVNGAPVQGTQMEDGAEVMEYLKESTNFPVSLKFGKPRLTSNDKIVLASMFHSLFAIASQLSPEPNSSGIELLEADTFKLYCFQTITGIKFLVMTDSKLNGVDNFLNKLYELYSDFALKNPFYSLEMPIRCELFDTNLQQALEQIDKYHSSTA